MPHFPVAKITVQPLDFFLMIGNERTVGNDLVMLRLGSVQHYSCTLRTGLNGQQAGFAGSSPAQPADLMDIQCLRTVPDIRTALDNI